MHLDVVELDPAIVKVSTEWFGLVPDSQLQLHTQDGLVYLKELAQSGEHQDISFWTFEQQQYSIPRLPGGTQKEIEDRI